VEGGGEGRKGKGKGKKRAKGRRKEKKKQRKEERRGNERKERKIMACVCSDINRMKLKIIKRSFRNCTNTLTLNTVLFFIHLFICAYIVWAISPPYLSLSLPPASLPGRICSVLISNFIEERV
jgi:hypothetical protein